MNAICFFVIDFYFSVLEIAQQQVQERAEGVLKVQVAKNRTSGKFFRKQAVLKISRKCMCERP